MHEGFIELMDIIGNLLLQGIHNEQYLKLGIHLFNEFEELSNRSDLPKTNTIRLKVEILKNSIKFAQRICYTVNYHKDA